MIIENTGYMVFALNGANLLDYKNKCIMETFETIFFKDVAFMLFDLL